MAGLICVLLLPRAASGWRGVLVIAAAAAGIAAAGWFGWAVRLPSATDRALVLLMAFPVLAALAVGLLVRAVVVVRRWPLGPDALLTAGGGAILVTGYLRLFDLI